MELKKYVLITGYIKTKTGMHIGASKESISIGGIDNPVICSPHNNLPYIPGSSLKGKIRTLLEYHLGKVESGEPHSCTDENCPICRIFGPGSTEHQKESQFGPSRAIFRDAFPESEDDVKIEEKVENRINRLTATAEHPRHMERVAPDSLFKFEISYRIFDEKDEEILKYLLQGLKLLENDYLGGSGSRGYGKVVFLAEREGDESTIKVDGETKSLQEYGNL